MSVRQCNVPVFGTATLLSFVLNIVLTQVCHCERRKLMGHRPNLQDLKDVHPTIAHSLQKLLAEDNAAQLGLVFQVMSSQKLHQWEEVC